MLSAMARAQEMIIATVSVTTSGHSTVAAIAAKMSAMRSVHTPAVM